MERLAILGFASMLWFYVVGGDKPWVTTAPRHEINQPCIEKPWVTTPPRYEPVQPCSAKPWVTPPPVPPQIKPVGKE